MPICPGNNHSGVSMPGRHQVAPSRRPALRWLAGTAGAGLLSALLLALVPMNAGAAPDPVDATFSVTGVAISGCSVSPGGSDVYVKPGQELDVSSSLVGIKLLGLGLSLGDYRGQLIIDPGSSNPIKVMTGSTPKPLPDLSAGDHTYS